MSRWVFFKWINRQTIPSGFLEIEDGYEPWGRCLFNWMPLSIICSSYAHRPVCSVGESMSCFGVLVRELIFCVVVRKRIKRSEESSKLISSSVNKSENRV